MSITSPEILYINESKHTIICIKNVKIWLMVKKVYSTHTEICIKNTCVWPFRLLKFLTKSEKYHQLWSFYYTHMYFYMKNTLIWTARMLVNFGESQRNFTSFGVFHTKLDEITVHVYIWMFQKASVNMHIISFSVMHIRWNLFKIQENAVCIP